MKKTYINPEITVVLIESRAHLLIASGEVGDTPARMKWDDYADDNEEGL